MIITILASALVLASAEPECRAEISELKSRVEAKLAERALARVKEVQISDLLRQAEQACDASDDLVAMAAVDQIKALLREEQPRFSSK